MSSKSNTEVLIGGKVYTLSGYEGEEYLQKVAAYINSKINEFNEMESVRRFPVDMKSTLLQLNIADDYFKAIDRAAVSERQRDDMERESYGLKHELVTTQMRLEDAVRNLDEKKAELDRVKRELEKVHEENLRLKAVQAAMTTGRDGGLR